MEGSSDASLIKGLLIAVGISQMLSEGRGEVVIAREVVVLCREDAIDRTGAR